MSHVTRLIGTIGQALARRRPTAAPPVAPRPTPPRTASDARAHDVAAASAAAPARVVGAGPAGTPRRVRGTAADDTVSMRARSCR